MTSLKKFLRSFIGTLFWISGAPLFIRVLCRKKVLILTYHNPNPKTFEKHLRYLKKRFNVTPLEKLVHAIKKNDWDEIPRRSIVITLDDGYKENCQLKHLFANYAVVPTIYLCSHIVNTHRRYWFDSGAMDPSILKGMRFSDLLKTLKDSQGFELEKEYEGRQALNYEELRSMQPFVDFQSHSKFHPILTTCDRAEMTLEIEDSKKSLEGLLKMRLAHFSYPNGDYSRRELDQVMQSGYESARTLDVGWNDRKTDPYRLKSLSIQDDASLIVLCAQVHGFFGYCKYAFHGRFNGTRPPFIT